MKRVFSAFVAWIMIFITSISALPVSAAGSSAEYIKYVVPFISDQTKQTQVCGLSNESLLKDGVVLIPLETACEIAGATIKAETDEAVIASRNYVSWCCNYNEHKKQYLLVDWHTGKGDYYAAALNCLKGSWTGLASFKYCFDGNAGISLPVDDVYNTDITYDLYQGTLYVSFYEFLDMMGVKVDVITHERVNAIIDLYDNVINAFSNAKNRNDADTIKKIFKDRVGYEQFFFCVLGTPIDALYQRYYDNHLQFKIDNYYSKNTVEWANLVNAVGNYEGLTKTAMAALNLNCDYEDALINVVKYHGSSANEDTTKVSSVIDVVQRMLVFADGAQNIKEICSDSNLSVSWDIQQKVNKQKPILSDGMGSKGQAVKASMTCISAFCCAAENYSKFKGLENLFLDEQYLLQNSILSSESFLDDVYEENKIDIDSTLGMLIPNFKTEKDIIDNLKNASNSYFNLYHSASKVQLIMDTSSPAAYSAVLGAIEDVAYSLADDALMSMIDAAFFGGAPVSSLVNDRVMVSVYHLKDGVYGKKSASISELDDYAFLQLVAKDCFREYDLESENAYSSFLLGLKATMLAYRSASIDANGDPNGEIPKELSDIYNQSCFASTDIYDASPGKCSNLTDVLGNNTDISIVDTVPHQGLTLEFQSENPKSSNWQFGSVVKNDSTIIYTKRDYNSMKYSIVEQNVQTGNSNTLVSTEMSSGNTHPNIALIGNSLYYSDENGLNLYNLENKSTELKWSEGYSSIIGVNETEQNLVLQREYEGTKYYTYNIQNEECKKIIDLNNSGLLTTDGANIYYYTNDDKIEHKIEPGFDKTFHTHVYKCDLASGVTTELTSIAINVPMGAPTYGVSYIANNRLILSYGFYDGGSSRIVDYTIAELDLQSSELHTIATDIATTDPAFEFNNPYVYYYKYDHNTNTPTTIQYDIETGEYKTLDLSWVDSAIDTGLLYTIENSNKHNYCKYELSSNQTITLIKQDELISSSDPSDAYCNYECFGVINDQAVIEVMIRSYQQEYFGRWRPGYVRSTIEIVNLDDENDNDTKAIPSNHDNEVELKQAVAEIGNVSIWAYVDYDGNGEKEAFAITTTEDDEIKAVYFVDSNYNVSVMQTSFDGLSYYESEEGYYRMHAGKGFFWCNYGAHGSGYHTMLYSVKDGTPYALDIASQLQGFYQDGESLYTIEDSFDAGYHQWFKKELVYDSATQQFRKGRVLGELD